MNRHKATFAPNAVNASDRKGPFSQTAAGVRKVWAARGRIGKQVVWSLFAKALAAVLQVAVIAELARTLSTERFAYVSSVYAVLQIVVVVNGFGLIQQIQVARARDSESAELAGLYNARLWFTYASALVWLIGCLSLLVITQSVLYLQLLPCTIWLVVEQSTSVWNGISIADHRNEMLVSSYLLRRAPVVLVMAAGPTQGGDPVWCWSLGLAGGSALAYLHGARRQESWSRTLLPPSLRPPHVRLSLGYWWSAVGDQARDLDVTVLAALNATTAGVYALPARFVRPMNLVTQAVSSVSFPALARRATVSGRELALATVAGAAPVAVVASAVATCAPLVPRLLGVQYSGAVPVLRVLSVAALVVGVNAMQTVYLQSRSVSAIRFAGVSTLGSAVSQVALAAALGLWFGPVGAAWGALVSQLALCLVLVGRSIKQVQCEAEKLASIGEDWGQGPLMAAARRT